MALLLPSHISSLYIWLKADALVGLNDGDPVAAWPDSSGNGRNLAQGTSGERGTYQTNEFGSLPVVRFDGVNDWLSLNPFTLTQPFTWFMVGRTVAARGNNVWWGGSASPTPIFYFTASNADAYAGSGIGIAGDGTIKPGNLWCGIFNTTTSDWRRDGDPALASNSGSPGNVGATNFDVLEVGRGWGGLGGVNTLQGDIAELGFYNRVLNSGERDQLEGYIAHKWGLSGNLPGGHTYKSSAPTIDRRGAISLHNLRNNGAI